MIPRRLRNNDNKAKKIRLTSEPYLFINFFFAVVILLIIAYSAIFSPVKDNYPVTCVHESLSGQPCASCGLSHSFSLIVRGEFDQAADWNPFGLRVFIFFATQLLFRIVFSVYYIRYPQNRHILIITDSTGSFIMLLIAFWPFIRWIMQVLSA